MRVALMAVALLGLALAVPAAAEAHDCSDAKIVSVARCPWPGGVGDFCVAYESWHLCFGPI